MQETARYSRSLQDVRTRCPWYKGGCEMLDQKEEFIRAYEKLGEDAKRRVCELIRALHLQRAISTEPERCADPAPEERRTRRR